MKRYLQYAIILLLGFSKFDGICASSDLELLRQKVLAEIMSVPVNDSQVEKLISDLSQDGTWPGINYDDVSNEGFEHRIHLGNMVDLARAYKSKKSKFFKSKNVKSAVISALSYWLANDFICENWWHNQIGTPGAMVNLMLLIGNELPKDLVVKTELILDRATINSPGARPGGDRIKIAGIQAKNMLFLGDGETFGKVVRVIEGEIKNVEWIGARYGYGFRSDVGGFQNRSENGRGIQYDNSFHHRIDGVNNTLSYGMSYAEAFIEWAVYTAGTKYAFSEQKLIQLIDYYLDGICKTSVYGKVPDIGAKNRAISREGALHRYSAKSAEKLLFTSNHRQKELQEIIDIRSKGIKPTLSHATFYWNSEHFSYQRPDWFTSVRMFSTRNYNMEQPYNSEGLLNHHRGDGTNYISVTGDEYDDIAPVYDYQKIPGTTVMQKPKMPPASEIQKLGLTDFVGAVTDGRYGAAAFDFKSPHDPLIARKAWFFFDNEYVCLGSGISCRNKLPVVTTLNQCFLRSDVSIFSQGRQSVLQKDEKEYENLEWIYQDGIGYVFPNATNVWIKNDTASGSWWDINKQSDSPKRTINREIFKAWLSHGERPSEASYQYIVVPATTIEKLASNSSKNDISVLSNTPEIQAVMNKSLQICQLVFYKAGELQISGKLKIAAENPGIVMLKLNGDTVTELSVADPNRELRKFHLSISGKMEISGDKITATWNEKNAMTEFAIDLPQNFYAGKSVTINF